MLMGGCPVIWEVTLPLPPPRLPQTGLDLARGRGYPDEVIPHPLLPSPLRQTRPDLARTGGEEVP